MNAHENVLTIGDPSVRAHPGDQRQVPVPVRLVGVANRGEHTVPGGHAGCDDAADEVRLPAAILAEVLDRDHDQVVLVGEGSAAGCPAHAAVVLDQLGDHSGWFSAGEPSQVDGRLGVARPNQNATVTSTQRQQMSRPDEVTGLGRGVGQQSSRARAVAGRDTSRDAGAARRR